jgi:hypothetical protein
LPHPIDVQNPRAHWVDYESEVENRIKLLIFDDPCDFLLARFAGKVQLDELSRRRSSYWRVKINGKKLIALEQRSKAPAKVPGYAGDENALQWRRLMFSRLT